jgi:uncharacterized protein (DUF433 family)
MKIPDRIEVRQDVMMGKPFIRGARILVYLLLEKMAAGETTVDLLAAYPQLLEADIAATLRYKALS